MSDYLLWLRVIVLFSHHQWSMTITKHESSVIAFVSAIELGVKCPAMNFCFFYKKRQSEEMPHLDISASGGFDIRYSASAYLMH